MLHLLPHDSSLTSGRLLEKLGLERLFDDRSNGTFNGLTVQSVS